MFSDLFLVKFLPVSGHLQTAWNVENSGMVMFSHTFFSDFNQIFVPDLNNLHSNSKCQEMVHSNHGQQTQMQNEVKPFCTFNKTTNP